jgi:RimJ/RimL family protein N-acetyltransferase
MGAFRCGAGMLLISTLFPAHRGKGVAPRAVRLMAEWAFGPLGLTELLLEIDPQNVASVRVAEKCGFEPADQSPTREPDTRSAGKLVFVRVPRSSATSPPARSCGC